MSPAVNTDVEFQITGMIARAKVTQTFQNPSDQWINARYVFPLPEDAAVDHLLMKVGDRTIEGQIQPKLKAREIFEQAKLAGKKASLVEQQRPNIFSNEIANIGPSEHVTVTIEYQQGVQLDKGIFSLRFPMTVGPRYFPGEPAVSDTNESGWAISDPDTEDQSFITAPLKSPSERPNNIQISIDLHAGFELAEIESEFHTVLVSESGAHQYQVQLAKEELANKDFVLNWQAEARSTPVSAMFTQMHDGYQYGLVMTLPPSTDAQTDTSIHREVVYVLDTSGSMSGASIKQAREALIYGLQQLGENDTFNVIEFNSDASQLWRDSQFATQNNKRTAYQYIQRLVAEGGTNIMSALQLALGNQPVENGEPSERIRQVMFLTDGSVGNEEQLMQYIEAHIGQSRLFTVGIGSAPNSYFMSEAAKVGRGAFTYIGNVNQVKEKMTTLMEKLEKPLLRDIHISLPSDAEFYPQPLPDLYDGQPLLVSFRSMQPVSEIAFTGQRKNQRWQQTLRSSGNVQYPGVGVYWARQKIADLERQKRGAMDRESLEQSILNTAMQHHLVSSMTSLVAVDITPTNLEQNAVDKKVPRHAAKGWKMFEARARLPQTSTDARWQLLVGLLLLGTALCVRLFR